MRSVMPNQIIKKIVNCTLCCQLVFKRYDWLKATILSSHWPIFVAVYVRFFTLNLVDSPRMTSFLTWKFMFASPTLLPPLDFPSFLIKYFSSNKILHFFLLIESEVEEKKNGHKSELIYSVSHIMDLNN